MRDSSHKSRIGIIRDHVAAWRKAQGWSRETAAAEIVAAHERIGGHLSGAIVFEKNGDVYTMQKNHADRIWRWLDDESKENNLMPANFENSILAALPMERRVELLNEVLAQIDCAARGRSFSANGDINPRDLVQTIMRANHRTESDAADLLDGIDPGELPRLHNSLVNDVRVKRSLIGAVESAMHRTGEETVSVLRKVS
ncbi:toxin YdaT family protein [Paraburkholderia tuberum]|uniref:Putative toxin ydaT n=1 Tax=Paraburkholderia tuberum TaxID=157910 RepID=A0A1H1JBB2_9BURK|nr:toxin YdaT family protein [Paraburkholderia tuberum]SDR47269.1 Putative toxin ydaT [Paraburkholderia tuberum]